MLFALALPLTAFAGQEITAKDEIYKMDKVVVTATGVKETVRDIPRNASVITRADIERSGSGSVADIISRQAGVTVQNLFGTDRNASVDLRGQGSVANTNVLILIDGQRVSPVDMGGANLNLVSLNDVESIEIVRGPSGVIYGDRAVGGVVNIITRNGANAEGFEGSVGATVGSYDATGYNAMARGRSGEFFGSVSASTYNTSGYRDNGGLWEKDFMGTFGWDASSALTLSVLGAYHQDRYGLPGGVSRSNFFSRDLRRKTSSPTAYGETEDSRVQGRAELDMDDWGALDVRLGMRVRNNPYDFGYGKNKIEADTTNLDVGYELKHDLFGLNNKLLAGGDVFSSHYKSGPVNSLNTNNVTSMGGFIHDTIAVNDALSLQAGYRFNSFDSSREQDGPNHFSNNAYEFGAVYKLPRETSLYANYATSFRTPAVDEMSFQDGDLRPQTGRNIEIGGRSLLADNLECSFAVYRSVTSDEIWFDPTTYKNKNYENDVKRTGVELELHYAPLESLSLWANYTYTEAKFETLNTTMPLVPKHMVNAGSDWNILPELLLNLTVQYASEKEVNTLNTADTLWAYTVVDTKLTYTYKQLKVHAGINNLFDSCYGTMAYGDTSYYAMPTRNFYSGIEWSF